MANSTAANCHPEHLVKRPEHLKLCQLCQVSLVEFPLEVAKILFGHSGKIFGVTGNLSFVRAREINWMQPEIARYATAVLKVESPNRSETVYS